MLALTLRCPACGTGYRPGRAACVCDRLLESVESAEVSEVGLPPLLPFGPPPPPASLVLVEAEGRPFLFKAQRVTSARLGPEVFRIGRADPLGGSFPEIDVTDLPGGAHVSRRHAEIYAAGEEVVLVDTGSSGGTTSISPDHVLTANEPIRLRRDSEFRLAGEVSFRLTAREGG